MKQTLKVLKELNSLQPEVSIVQLYILSLIRDKESINYREISLLIGISTAGVTGQIDRLVKLGLVERVHRGSVEGQDRRYGGATLLPPAVELLEKVDGIMKP
jgi:DNA-binding MarR family transcriptional regulator